MTRNNDIILKSWLRTLRYSVEYYEDRYDLRDGRKCEENGTMVIGGVANEDHYVNLWERSNVAKSTSKSRFEAENTSVASRKLKKPVVTPRLSKKNSSQLKNTEYHVQNSPDNSSEAQKTVRESSKDVPGLDEEVCTTIQYLEEVLDAVDTSSDDSDIEECPVDLDDPHGALDSDVSSISSIVQQEALVPVEEAKFTGSSSSFEEYIGKDDSFNLKFAKENRTSAFLEEPEPVLPQEVKNIPIPRPKNRFGWKRPQSLQRAPLANDVLEEFEEFGRGANVKLLSSSPRLKRPQSLQSPAVAAEDSEDFESVSHYPNDKLSSGFLHLQKPTNATEDLHEPEEYSHYVNVKELFSSPALARTQSLQSPRDATENLEESDEYSHYVNVKHLVCSSDLARTQSLQSPRDATENLEESDEYSHYVNVKHLVSSLGLARTQSLQSASNVAEDLEESSPANKIPQSLQSSADAAEDLEESEDFGHYANVRQLNSSRDHNDTNEFTKEAEDEPLYENLPILLAKIGGSVESRELGGDSQPQTQSLASVEEEDTCVEGDKQLNLSYASESRVSAVFEVAVDQVDEFEVAAERVIFEEEEFLDGLKGDVVLWMSDLMTDCFGEKEDIMEEKELLKSINQFPKERIERPSENKFPLDDENVEVRRKPSIRRNRVSKTTDFDLGRRRQESPINPKNFDIRGLVKFQKPNGSIVITKLNQEYVAYENENFYRVNEKTKAKELLCQNVLLKSARYSNAKAKDSKEVELKDNQNLTYILYFDNVKLAKQFMEHEKIQNYVTDNKVTIKKTLLRFLGKRSSREILERKGIYKNEPIFGNTLRDIYAKSAGTPVPMFIYKVIELIEKPENIKSLGLYRTSGNLATIQKIRCEVDNGKLDILNQFSKDPDVLTGSLKLFFRELKEPLIPTEVCDKMMEIVKTNPKQLTSRDHQKIKSIFVKNLHEANLETFIVIMQHLLCVVRYKEHNKMDTYNLAVCWGPSMIFSVTGVNLGATFDFNKDIVTQSHDATRLVDFLLGYYEMYPGELGQLTKRLDSIAERILAFKRQESRDSVDSSDSSKSQKKSASSLSLSVDEITKKLVEMIEPHLSTEGLYKKTGTADKTNKIFKKLNKKKVGELDKYKNDVHDLTDALKKYLKEQQDGLVGPDTVELVLRAANDHSQSYLEPITRRKVTALIEDTPKKDTFTFLLRHLAKVIDHQSRQGVPKSEIVDLWTAVLNCQKKCRVTNEDFAQFLTVAVEVFNDNLPDIVRSSFNNNGTSPNRNEIMGEVVKQIKHQQERDRHSRYDNVDCDVAGEASILEEKTEQTKL